MLVMSLLLVFSLMLVSCGGGEAEEAPAEEPAAEEVAAPAEEAAPEEPTEAPAEEPAEERIRFWQPVVRAIRISSVITRIILWFPKVMPIAAASAGL